MHTDYMLIALFALFIALVVLISVRIDRLLCAFLQYTSQVQMERSKAQGEPPISFSDKELVRHIAIKAGLILENDAQGAGADRAGDSGRISDG